jgi:hypothetical protein
MDRRKARKPRRWILATLACILLIGVGGFVGFAKYFGGGLFGCEDEDVCMYPSPLGTYEARIYVRDCGATTSWATHVKLTQKRRLLPDVTSLIFVADGNHGRAPRGPANGPEVRLRWNDDNHLVITHHKYATVFRSDSRFEDVTIDRRSFD